MNNCARPGWNEIPVYTAEEGVFDVKLDANERAEDFPPALRRRIAAKLANLPLNRYPEIAARPLRKKLAARLGVAWEQVLVGGGSSELLAAACRAFGGPGRQIVFPSPSFSMYPVYVRLADSEPQPVGLRPDFSLPVPDVIAAAADPAVSLVILCNPNNPTGTVTPPQDVEAVAAGVKCPVLVDEAYYEFYGQSALGLIEKYPNVVVARTFSKAYGLAAARVGYLAAAPAIAALIAKAIMPYGLNALSMAAAEAALEMDDFMRTSVALTAAERDKLADALAARGFTVFPSSTNFLLFRGGDASALSTRLAEMGIGVRNFSRAPGLEGCIRVTVGAPAENEAFLTALDGLGDEG